MTEAGSGGSGLRRAQCCTDHMRKPKRPPISLYPRAQQLFGHTAAAPDMPPLAAAAGEVYGLSADVRTSYSYMSGLGAAPRVRSPRPALACPRTTIRQCERLGRGRAGLFLLTRARRIRCTTASGGSTAAVMAPPPPLCTTDSLRAKRVPFSTVARRCPRKSERASSLQVVRCPLMSLHDVHAPTAS